MAEMESVEMENVNPETRDRLRESRENVRLQVCMETEEERKKIAERSRNGTRRSSPTMVVRVSTFSITQSPP